MGKKTEWKKGEYGYDYLVNDKGEVVGGMNRNGFYIMRYDEEKDEWY